VSQTFNASGTGGRDCPICYRAGTLAGLRDGDAPRLTCSGCFTRFVLTWADGRGPDQLTRIPTPEPVRPPFTLTPPSRPR
jgi:hypothetical protein